LSGLISVDDALTLLAQHKPDTSVETVPIAEAQGRQLAEPVSARVSRPPANVSAMDGYAVRLVDVGQPGARLRVAGEAPAGAPFAGRVSEGQAVRIFTGGELPDGADHIVIQEDADRDGDEVTCREAYDSAQFVRPAGMDFKRGAVLMAPGTVIEAAELALAASANLAALPVYRRPRIGVLANGNELRAPGSELGPGEIVNSNPIGLSALIRDWGGEPVNLGIAKDTMESIASHIADGDSIDIFLPVGGASVGDHDLMRPAFAAAGFKPVFEKVAVRPGKPTWFSTRADASVLGLPGNPASALVCAQLFLKPLINGRMHHFVRAAAAVDIPANGPREHFMRASVDINTDGRLQANPATNQDSSLIRPFLLSAGLVRRKPNSPAVKAGELVDLLVIRPVYGV